VYFKVANALSLDYWLVMANGDYKSEMKVDVDEVIDLLKNGGERYDENDRVQIIASLDEAKSVDFNEDLTFKAWNKAYKRKEKEHAKAVKEAKAAAKAAAAEAASNAQNSQNSKFDEDAVPALKSREEEEDEKDVDSLSIAGEDDEES
jgi:hypothetical protein